MNILALVLGAAAAGALVKGGEAREIRELKKQLPEGDREGVLQGYKRLSGKDKSDFKTALRNADIAAASQILGQDLSKFNLAIGRQPENPTAGKNAGNVTGLNDMEDRASPTSDFAARIERILAVPTSIDPELVAEAARRYEQAVPRGSADSISDKTKKLLELKA